MRQRASGETSDPHAPDGHGTRLAMSSALYGIPSDSVGTGSHPGSGSVTQSPTASGDLGAAAARGHDIFRG